MKRKHIGTVSKTEVTELLKQRPKVGDILAFCRNKPHTSKLHPFLHVDIIFARFDGGHRFVIVDKYHVALITHKTT